MINWDPAARTALSDEEVEYRDVEGTLYYIRYPILGFSRFLLLSLRKDRRRSLGDTAVCVHPDDPKYRHFLREKNNRSSRKQSRSKHNR